MICLGWFSHPYSSHSGPLLTSPRPRGNDHCLDLPARCLAGLRLKQASPREPPAKFSEIGAYNISCHVLGRDVIKSEYFHDF